ncbi:hypothetical protein GCM10009828_080170 [Actinoplanes couchii]|uniref:GGDEF domain-containing protein n=1 Tax=Actinoplanes couchii TaxID=403638 RepID=A0ABQ3XK41_9ACTN|nr:hypothetical protein Aco03nite_072680 [Actinoplanes couchii]
MLATPSVVLPGSTIAVVCYLAGLCLIGGYLVAAARSLPPGRRRAWLPLIVMVALGATGPAVFQLAGLPGAPAAALNDVALLLWLGVYPPAALAVHRMLAGRALPRPVRRAIVKDVLVVTAAALMFAWYLLIRPALPGVVDGDRWGVIAVFCYPLGDVVLLALAVTVLLIPGRRTVPEHLIVAGFGLSLLVDVANTLLPVSATDANVWYMPTYLVINALLTAATVHPDRDAAIRPVSRSEPAPGMRGWRMALLGAALCGVGLSTIVLPHRGWERGPAAACMTVMIVVILSRLRRAVADLEDAERTLRHQATHDQLTGLANRSRLLTDMRDAVHDAPTLFFVDLDGFKAVNDTHGHHCGDVVLQTVAARLTRIVRSTDTVARLGGDEFVVVCTALDTAATASLSQRIESVLAEPIDVGDCTVAIGASIGVLTLPATVTMTEQQTDNLISELLSTADAAMYEAKRAGGGTRTVEHTPLFSVIR